MIRSIGVCALVGEGAECQRTFFWTNIAIPRWTSLYVCHYEAPYFAVKDTLLFAFGGRRRKDVRQGYLLASGRSTAKDYCSAVEAIVLCPRTTIAPYHRPVVLDSRSSIGRWRKLYGYKLSPLSCSGRNVAYTTSRNSSNFDAEACIFPYEVQYFAWASGGGSNLSVWNVRLAHFWVVCAINAIFVCLYRGGSPRIAGLTRRRDQSR